MSDNEWLDDSPDTVAPSQRPPPTTRRRRRRHLYYIARSTTSKKPLPPPASSRGPWPQSSRHRVEFVRPVKPSAKEGWRRFFSSDLIDLALVFVIWTVVGGLIYVLHVDVPRAYHDAMWVCIALFSAPMGLFTGLHVYELYVLRQASRKGRGKVLIQ
ncbi:hypothetical protein H257_06905 [Aphanomyces astaci]|uniref:Uncharacterized protein n=1 Tax=Aphanomyces astaci TaxID=112090 RepID=W4GJ02_APHAT|nr:hypothetical protein H257_06905 [Aphanomyces astaci]ETV79652.1 hypothetical protein H257_06905 [Aphanomyces astaci]|eukprot:XP_009830588.1 hypothetical protein H257_06905 [Aphanomyces astaci]